jgi:hypothetical protein
MQSKILARAAFSIDVVFLWRQAGQLFVADLDAVRVGGAVEFGTDFLAGFGRGAGDQVDDDFIAD